MLSYLNTFLKHLLTDVLALDPRDLDIKAMMEVREIYTLSIYLRITFTFASSQRAIYDIRHGAWIYFSIYVIISAVWDSDT
jgi:hypothetical protein